MSAELSIEMTEQLEYVLPIFSVIIYILYIKYSKFVLNRDLICYSTYIWLKENLLLYYIQYLLSLEFYTVYCLCNLLTPNYSK